MPVSIFNTWEHGQKKTYAIGQDLVTDPLVVALYVEVVEQYQDTTTAYV